MGRGEKCREEKGEKEIILLFIFKKDFANQPILSRGGSKSLLPYSSWLC